VTKSKPKSYFPWAGARGNCASINTSVYFVLGKKPPHRCPKKSKMINYCSVNHQIWHGNFYDLNEPGNFRWIRRL